MPTPRTDDSSISSCAHMATRLTRPTCSLPPSKGWGTNLALPLNALQHECDRCVLWGGGTAHRRPVHYPGSTECPCTYVLLKEWERRNAALADRTRPHRRQQ